MTRGGPERQPVWCPVCNAPDQRQPVLSPMVRVERDEVFGDPLGGNAYGQRRGRLRTFLACPRPSCGFEMTLEPPAHLVRPASPSEGTR